MKNHMLPAEEVVEKIEGLGFEKVKVLHGSTFKDASTIVVVPTRGMVHHRTVAAWQSMLAPMNQKKAFLFAIGHEVGKAYDAMIANILADSNLRSWKYLLTLEDDNLPPPDAHIRLLESIEEGAYDAVSGLYWTKGEYQMPMAYGDPETYRKTGQLEFRPRDVRKALAGGNVLPVNGIAMGCGLWRLDLFRQIPAPWFVTVSDVVPDKGPTSFTQDLYFCERACRAGKRFAVDMRVKVGHLDVNSGVVY